MLDFHTHVWPHQPGTPTPTLELLESYCSAAEARGISQIAITEHSHRFVQVAEVVLPYWERPRSGDVADATAAVLEVEGGADLDAYADAIEGAKSQGLPILLGLEVDHLPGAGPAMADLLDGYPFDVLLGSVHWLDDWLFDAYGTAAFAEQWNVRDVDDVFDQYVDSVIELARSGAVDVLAHLDVIKVAGHSPGDPARYQDRLAEALAPTDMVIEFSSAGLRKPAAATYPSLELLDRLIDSGLELVTASDAHTPAQVGLDFDVLAAELDRRGIATLATFSGRQRGLYQR